MIDTKELRRLLAEATAGEWMHGSALGGWDAVAEARNPKSLVCMLSLNNPANASAIAALHNAAPALIAAAQGLAWQDERHGTRAEQEALDAALAVDLARIDALSDEECKAELAAEGIDYDAARKKIDVTLKLCAERAELKREVEQLRAFVPVWRREGSNWRLYIGRALIGEIDGMGFGLARVGVDDVLCYSPVNGCPNVAEAARAVCARLGIPDVGVPDV